MGGKYAKCYLAGGKPNWARIRVGGHSQGGVLAAAFAYRHKVARAVFFNSPACQFGEPLNWIRKDKASIKTPSDRIFGLESRRDRSLLWKGSKRNGKTMEMEARFVKLLSHVNTWHTMGCSQKGVQADLKTMGDGSTTTVTADSKDRCGCGRPVDDNGSCCWTASTSPPRVVVMDMKGIGHTQTCMGGLKKADWRHKYWRYVVGIDGESEYGYGE